MNNKALLVAVNAKYIHSNPAVYCLKAYAEKKNKHVEIAEYTINNIFQDIIIDIYKRKPDFIGFSCYIWNIELVDKIARECRLIMPDIQIWYGGPEVSFDAKNQLAEKWYIDGIMSGEGEITLTELLSKNYEEYNNIKGITYRKNKDEIVSTMCRDYMNMDDIPFIYSDMSNFENRIVYYESSRGCPYSCSYCMSSIDKRVRFRSLNLVKEELKFFLDNDIPQVKFVDRTFNCDKSRTLEIWKFIKENDNGITNFHFEVSADILDEDEIDMINSMRPRLIQLEIGVQTTNNDTISAIHRKMNFNKLADIVRKINCKENVHQHLDLIAGLPYEDMESFKKSFEDVYALEPDQLQLGFLKVLKGSFMYDMTEKYGIVYEKQPPYEVLYTKWISYDDVIKLKSVEDMTEIYYNSGQFRFSIRFLQNLFDKKYDLYDSLARYYEESGQKGKNYTRMERFVILLNAAGWMYEEKKRIIDERFGDKDQFIATFSQILVHDMYLRENMKTRPFFAEDECVFKDIYNKFFKDEDVVKNYLNGYEEYNTKQIARMTHVEHYNIDVMQSVNRFEKVEQECILLYDYRNRKQISYDANVIDVTKAVLVNDERWRVSEIIRRFNEQYSTEYKCYLNHDNAWQLLIATILSAQCTDERVNIVTKDLFKKYTSLEDFAQADTKELEKEIYSTGFYKNKAKNIIECARKLVNDYGSEVPSDLKSLTSLAGVGRKTANVIRGNIFNEPSIVVDTHVKRISKKLGFTSEDDPEKIEYELMNILPRDHWILYNIQIITHGRSICTAIRPKCDECFLKDICPSSSYLK